MNKYENEMKEVLMALNESGALKYVVISGSWAMYFYSYIFDNFIAETETTDLDLYLPNPKKAKSNDLSTKLRELKYIQNIDCLTNKTTFLSKEGFSIEFLATPDRTMSNTISVPGLSVTAEALPKMAPAGWNYVTIEWNNMNVNVASPVSFVLQKLLINKDRKSDYKKAKDLDAVRLVLSYIKLSPKYKQELKDSLETYPKKWKKTILQTAEENNIFLD